MDVLRIAGGEGRLSAEELDARLESALSARTLGELAALTADLPAAPAAARDLLVVRQQGGKYVQEGRWQVPARIELHAQMCRVTLDLSHAVLTSNVLRIDVELVHGKLLIVTGAGTQIDAAEVVATYSKVKLHPPDLGSEPRLRIELAGTLTHARIVERRARR